MVYGIELGMLGLVLLVMIMSFRPVIKVKNKKEIGVKRASAIYADEKGAKLLIAPNYDLQGKPDYIFEKWWSKKLIPLEIKSGKNQTDEPHEGDLYQLVAYFLIIEEVYGKRPPYGKLVYANKTFTIKNTMRLRRQVQIITRDMRRMLEENYHPKVAPSFIKCKNCVCQHTVCEFCEGD